MWLVHVVGRSLSLDTGLAAHKLSVVPYTRSLFLATTVAATVLLGCGDREPEPSAGVPQPPAVTPLPSAAEISGWPVGLGRALVIRLPSPGDAYRLVVPELGDRRFADSAISFRAGDMIPIALFGHNGKAGEAHLRIVDSEAGSGSCVTWPAAEIAGATYVRRAGASWWRLAAEHDSVAPISVDSFAAMPLADSLSLAGAVNSLLATVPPPSDSALRGIPFGIRRAYSFRVAGNTVIVAELVRTSSTEADPREERLFVVGERDGDTQTYRLGYSMRAIGRADSTAVTELLAVVVSQQSGRAIIALSVEGASGLRLNLLERVARRRWRLSWSSVVSFC